MRFMFKVMLVLLLSFQTAQASLSKGLAAAQAGDYVAADAAHPEKRSRYPQYAFRFQVELGLPIRSSQGVSVAG